MLPKIRVPQNGWFTIEIPIKMDDWGVPLVLETSIYTLIHYVFSGSIVKLSGRDVFAQTQNRMMGRFNLVYMIKFLYLSIHSKRPLKLSWIG